MLVAFLILASLVMFGLFQLPQSKQWLAGEVERQLTTQFQGTFRIDRISGIPPFHLTLHNIRITLPESEESVMEATSARLELQPWNLIRQRVTFRQIHLEEPMMHLQMLDNRELNLAYAVSKRLSNQRPDTLDLPLIQTQWEWIAPQITMEGGAIRTSPPENSQPVHPLNWLPATDLDASFYLEITDEQRFLDIGHLHALFADERMGPVRLRGQLFSDSRFLELNGFELSSRESRVRWSLEASPVDLASDEWLSQLSDAVWSLRIEEATIPGERLQRLWSQWPFPESLVDLSLQGEGTVDQFFVDRISAQVGESNLLAGVSLESPFDSTARWEASLRNLVFSTEEAIQLNRIPTAVGDLDLSALAGTRMNGQLDGSRQHVSLNLDTETLHGQLTLDGRFGLGDVPSYRMQVHADSIQYATLLPEQAESGVLNGNLEFDGEGWPVQQGVGKLSLSLQQTQWNRIPIHEAISSIRWENGQWTHQSSIRTDRSSARLQGRIEERDGRWSSQLEGNTTGLDLTRWVSLPIAPVTQLDMEFDTSLEWERWIDLSGRIGLNVRSATVNGERLNSHQLFADLDPVSEGRYRQLRLTSSLFDAELTGTIQPENMVQSARYWGAYLKERMDDELRMSGTTDESIQWESPTPLQLELRLNIKDLGPLQAYLPDFPDIQTRSRVSLNLESTADQMLLTGSASDQELQFHDLRLTRPDVSLTASFRHNTPLREYSAIDLRILAEETYWGDRRLGRHFSNLTVRNDTARVHQTQMNGEFLRGWDMTLTGTLSEGSIDAELRQLYLNLGSVEWIHDGTARLHIDDRQVLDVQGFALESGDQRVELDGRYSYYSEDEVRYAVENLDLSLLSDALNGRVRFSGRMDGEFVTSMLTRDARLGGAFTIRDGRVMDRPVGLVTIESNYHPAGEHFDTRIEVRTDPEIHSAYLESNNGVGNHLILDGNVSLPSLSNPGEEFFYFDADLREIDTWIASVIVPKIIDEAEGRTTGWGFVSGSLEDINFRTQFDIDQVLVTPT
ncbi:MAG: AsmA family protein, partial [Balneolaceae bacterium]